MPITRREFLRHLIYSGLALASVKSVFNLTGCASVTPATPSFGTMTSPSPTLSPERAAASATPPLPVIPEDAAYLSVAHGNSPQLMVERAIKSLGGMERFVKKGDEVIIKPNICVAYHTYEYAATTNPEVVAALTGLCLNAGAKRVRVMDQPFGGTPEQAYAKSGIGEAVRQAGGEMVIMSPLKYRDTPIPAGKDITRWSIYGDALDCDVLINVPIAKHHNLARLTLGMKNLMGLVESRNQLHQNLGQRLADLTTLLYPALTVIDAVRILTNHGPTGGDLKDVRRSDTVIASHDIITADTYAATLFGLTANDIPSIRAGLNSGLGVADLKSIRIDEINI